MKLVHNTSMRFCSTGSRSTTVSLREAVESGLAPDEGLYVPAVIPGITEPGLEALRRRSFRDVSLEVARLLFGEDVSGNALSQIVEEAFRFDVPVNRLSDRVYVLELTHGPTLSFKDFGARFMARLIAHWNQDSDRELIVLVATSGDTGSAVAHGFLNIHGIRVVLLYPGGKVSEMQEKQLTTAGANIKALEIQGTFDDCQRLVKSAFLDPALQKLRLTSANSINVGRWLPQCFYYFYAWTQLEPAARPPVFSVPSGNFGNLSAGLLAKKMGLPVHRFIAATNLNDVVPEYLQTGVFRPRPSIQTLSNAMDVGNPSNFARILALYGTPEEMRKHIIGCGYTDPETEGAILELFQKYGYVADPHGAIGYLGLRDFLRETSDSFAGIFLETADPAKFPECLKRVLNMDVEPPSPLKEALSREKHSVRLSTRYEDFRSFLLGM